MSDRLSFRLALFATLLAFCVVVLGAYTRLTDAGLGCPDWPGCYGHLTVPNQLNEISRQGIDAAKAWTEMTHRYVAGLLGLVILGLAILAIRNRRYPNQPVVLPIALVILVVMQALLGMWTVTLKLFPLVVVAHLLGGMATLALLWWLTLELNPKNFNQYSPGTFENDPLKSLRVFGIFGLVILIIQIGLGGWTSANYAALACVDFPFCQGKLIPQLNFPNAFNLTAAGVTGSQGEPLNLTARVTIQFVHRLGALITALVIGSLAFLVFSKTHSITLKAVSIIIAVLLILQIILGITNVLALLPLPIAVLHNAVAALLLLALVTLNFYLHAKVKTEW